MKNIGPTFSAELSAAGLLGLPFAWAADGALTFGDAMTAEQIAAVEAVYAAHDPSAVSLTEKTEHLRKAREVILNRLSGIALAAQLTGDTATTAAYVTVRQGLLDITANLPQDATVDAVVMGRYAALVAQCTPQMITAFAQVDQ